MQHEHEYEQLDNHPTPAVILADEQLCVLVSLLCVEPIIYSLYIMKRFNFNFENKLNTFIYT